MCSTTLDRRACFNGLVRHHLVAEQLEAQPKPRGEESQDNNPATHVRGRHGRQFSSPQWSCRTRSKRHGDGKIEQKRGQVAHPTGTYNTMCTVHVPDVTVAHPRAEGPPGRGAAARQPRYDAFGVFGSSSNVPPRNIGVFQSCFRKMSSISPHAPVARLLLLLLLLPLPLPLPLPPRGWE